MPPRNDWTRAFCATACLAAAQIARPALAQDGWRFGSEGLNFRRGDFRLDVGGYVQGDFRSFRDWDAGDEDTGILRSDTSELRRVRVGFDARWNRLSVEFDIDPHQEGDRLKNAFAALRVAKGLRVQGGHFKLPVSAEWLTSAARTDFVERALLASHLAPSRDWGAMVQGEPWRWLLVQAGVFQGDARTRHDRAGTTGIGRVVLSPLRGLDLGGSFSQADVKADPAGPGLDPSPKGVLGEGPSGFAFYERHFVNGRRQRLGFEGSIRRGPARLTGEWLRMREERKGQGSVLDDLPAQVATGWSTAATWLITGEKKDSNIKPRHPLPHGPGAVELGVRVESIHYDDDGPAGGFEGVGNRARNIRPAGDRIFTGGLSWWPVACLRLMGNVLVERYEDALFAPEPGRPGNYITLLGRVQFQLR